MTFIDMNGISSTLKPWVIWVVLAIYLVLLVGFYLLRSIGLFTLAKRNGRFKGDWTVWVPFAWVYGASKLAGDVYLFGKKISAFPLIILIVSLTTGICSLTVKFAYYLPMVAYYFQGGEVLLSNTTEFFPIGSYYISSALAYICVPNINFPYSPAIWTLLDVLYYVQSALSIAQLVLMVFMLSAFFRSYLPGHYLVATIFSVLGLFPPFAFAVRKNTKIDYNEYVRAQYIAFYGNQPPHQNGNGYNNYNNYNNYGNTYTRSDITSADPFSEFEEKKEEPFSEFGAKNDDPFEEFNGKDN